MAEPAEGDEIAVFTDDGLCTGAYRFEGETPFVITAWRDDTCTVVTDGYLENETMNFRFWDASEEVELEIEVTYSVNSVMEDDPEVPRYGAFGQGYYAARSLKFDQIAETPAVPTEYALLNCQPNPFNAVTLINYDLPVTSKVRVEVYNITGQQVAVLLDGVQPAGHKQVRWNGVTQFGSTAASGLYILNLQASPTAGGKGFSARQKMLLLK